MQRKKILVFCDYYLPGFKSGGGMWTVVNLVDRFHDRYDFHIVTRNHDGKMDTTPYDSVKTGEWNSVGPARVFYIDRGHLNSRTFERLINDVKPDLVFLNSVFSTPSITFLRTRKSKPEISAIPVVLSPCGELAQAALKLKAFKKSLFLAYAKLAGLYRGVVWRASFEQDAAEIRRAIDDDIEIYCAPDLPPKTILPEFQITDKPEKMPGSVKFIFVSRVVRKKNLHFFLERLLQSVEGEIAVEIVGPIEDQAYWSECEAITKRLPSNVKMSVVGAVPYGETLTRMQNSHFFVLPTLNENFGYVFLEAMAAGCPLLISDRTAWNEINERDAGWTISLDDPEQWDQKIRQCVQMDGDTFARMANAARELTVKWLADPSVEQATGDLLQAALNS